MNKMLDQTLKNLNLKVFFLSLAGQFIISSLLYFGVRAPAFLNFLTLPKLEANYSQIVSPSARNLPQLTPKPDIFQTITPKLEQKPNDFELKKQSSLIATAYADTNYGSSNAYLSVDLDTGTVLISKNADQRLPIASLTKVMTAMVALDLMDPQDRLTVQAKSTRVEPSKLNLKAGESYTLEQLLNGMLISSANDCAQVIKDDIDQKYGEAVFVRAMNQKAQFLGLENSHFANPQGFDNPEHYSSASDLAVLTAYALRNYPLIDQIVKKPSEDISPATGFDSRLYLNNWNGLLGVYPGVYGVKIGNTDQAGKTTLVAAKRGGKNVLAVFLGAADIYGRDLGAAQLLDDSFAKYKLAPVGVSRAQLKAKYQSWKYF